MIQYYDLGAEKRLNEIVMVGSHDAGITEGKWNAKTQKLDIAGQAAAGVRVFDLRVAGTAVQAGLKSKVELRTYHGTQVKSDVRKKVRGLDGKHDVVESVMALGTWGETLLDSLTGAKAFVEQHTSEFLILKFDKCQNWPQIAEMCVRHLGTALYTGSGNLNKKTLFHLKGKVVVVFTTAGLNAIPHHYHGAGGILGVKSLAEGDAYQKDFNGLQYVGKGGTKLKTREGKSVQENIDKQISLMQRGVAGDPNVMGMMYWTTTGLVGSIHSRNKMMWKGKNADRMMALWHGGLGDAVKARTPACVDPASFAGGTVLKRFLPNIVMIDFASPDKCALIYNLNFAIPTQLTALEQQLIAQRVAG